MSSQDAGYTEIITGDGSVTLVSGRYGQAYSSVHGARGQARTVFVGGTGVADHPAPRVLEVGFGLGHNFRATLESLPLDASLEYLAYEFDPVPRRVLSALELPDPGLWGGLIDAWGGPLRVERGNRSVEVRVEDVTAAQLPVGWATAVYLDGFSPRVNPEVWSVQLISRLAATLQPGGRLATYSAAGHVRRALEAAGLRVERRRGLAGKREFVVASRP